MSCTPHRGALQDHVEPFPFSKVEAIVESERDAATGGARVAVQIVTHDRTARTPRR